MTEDTKINIDFSQLSDTQLQYLLDGARKILETRQRKKRAEVIDTIRKLAASVGLEVEIFDIGETAKKTAWRRHLRKRKPARPKYGHPDNPDLVWSGRGKMPRWFSQLLDQGYRREDLELTVASEDKK